MINVCLLALLAGGCDAAATDSGVTAWLRVAGAAQFTPGPLPAAAGGPPVTGLINLQNAVAPGRVEKPLGGTLGAGATAAALMLDGDLGFWLVAAGPPAITAPDQPTFAVQLSLSPSVPPGPRRLLVQARDADGRPGLPLAQGLDILDPAGRTPTGSLVVTLRWDRQADLDLHVEQPDGIEIWTGMKTGYQAPPGQPPDPDALARAGRLDVDSNAGCVLDGRQQEDVVFATAAPPGRYRVRVDTPSLCGQDSARWTVEVRRAGALGEQAAGEVTDAATRGGHGAGDGVLALELDVR